MKYGYEVFEVSVVDGIATIWFEGRDDEHLYLPDDHAAFVDLGRELAADDDVRVAVMAARGASFSAGIMRTRAAEADASARLPADYAVARDSVSVWLELPKPFVVVVNGVALHGALTLAMMADIVVAERRAWFRDVHTELGLISATGPFLWPLSIGLLRAKRYILTGDWLSAEEAERVGLVTEVVGDGEGYERGMEYARRLAGLDRFALGHTKRGLNEWLKLGQSAVYEQLLAAEFFGLARGVPVEAPVGYRVPPVE